MGPNAGVSTGHPLATSAALEVLLKGGNAFDAGVAAMLACGVLEQDLYSLGGEGTALLYPKATRKVISINGVGWTPKAATLESYVAQGKTMAGTGLDPAVVPGVLHSALTILERWGTMSFEQVSARAVEYAEQGFPLRPRTIAAIDNKDTRKFMESWPENRAMWLKPDGSSQGRRHHQAAQLARTLKRMIEAERGAAAKGRAPAIAAARDRFYKGDIAAEMVAFLKANRAPWELDDFAEYATRIEEPTHTSYRGYEVYKQSFNSQGPVLLEALNILELFDLQAMKHNSADYLHTVVEALKLAYADRESFYADPAFVDVPAEGLLSKAYAKERARLIDPMRASRAFMAGNPLPFDSKVKTWPFWTANIADAYEPGKAAPAPEPIKGIVRTRRISRWSIARAMSSTARRAARGFPPRWCWARRAFLISVRRSVLARPGCEPRSCVPRLAARYTISLSLVPPQRPAVPGDRHTGRRQPGADDSGRCWHHRVRPAVHPNLHEAFEWPRVQTAHFYATVAARRRLQQAERRSAS